jgi:hypothetical protein
MYSTLIHFINQTNTFIFKESTLENNALIPSLDPSLEHVLQTILVFLILPPHPNVSVNRTPISPRCFNSETGQKLLGAKPGLKVGDGTISMPFFCRNFN